MRRIILTAALLAVFAAGAQAQERVWTLSQCIDHALDNSLRVKQGELGVEQKEISLNTAENSRLPGVSASSGQNFSFGRGLTADNTYANTNTTNTSFSIGADVPVFNGFRIKHNIELSKLDLAAATADLEKARDDIRVAVAQAYVQILYNMEIANVAHRQVVIDSMQVVRLQAFVDNGKASGAQLSQQQATLANSRFTAVQADNNQRLAVLTLTQLLELPTPDGFAVVQPETSAISNLSDIPSPDVIYADALGMKPEVIAQQLRLRATDHSIKIAQAGYMPTLSFSGGLGSNYYTTSKFDSDPFGTQLKNNFSQYIGLSLNIPIFNRFQTRNSVRNARIEQENQLLALDNTKKTLYKEIQQVYYNTLNARQKERSSEETVRSSNDAFTLMLAKYENGKANITEFNEAKNVYLKAESDRVQALYELLYQRALIQFYQGRELSF